MNTIPDRMTAMGVAVPARDDMDAIASILQLLRILYSISTSSAQHFGEEGRTGSELPSLMCCEGEGRGIFC